MEVLAPAPPERGVRGAARNAAAVRGAGGRVSSLTADFRTRAGRSPMSASGHPAGFAPPANAGVWRRSGCKRPGDGGAGPLPSKWAAHCGERTRTPDVVRAGVAGHEARGSSVAPAPALCAAPVRCGSACRSRSADPPRRCGRGVGVRTPLTRRRFGPAVYSALGSPLSSAGALEIRQSTFFAGNARAARGCEPGDRMSAG